MARSYPETVQRGINTPPSQDFDTPAMQGSIQQFLADNLGTYVDIEFLVGTQSVIRKAGVLYAVGTSVVTLYEELTQTFVTCDMFSVKFVTFYLPGRRPWQVGFSGQTPGAWTPAPIPAGPMGSPAPGFAPPIDMAQDTAADAGQQTALPSGCGSMGPMPSWG